MEMIDKVRKLSWPASPRPQHWEDEQLFFDSDSYFADLLAGIAQSQSTIRLETYIFAPGRLGWRVTEALVAAAARGVKVKLLVDGIGSPAFEREYGGRLKMAGVEYRIFRRWWWASANRGNHRKTCLIDDTVAWIGSMNIDDIHLTELSGDRAWMDIGVRIRGLELLRLRQAFLLAFHRNFLQFPYQTRRSLLLLNNSFVLNRTTKHHQVQRMREAAHRVWIQTPYFVPIPRIYRALVRLARKGVDVRIIVPVNNDVPFIKHLSYAFFHRLLKAGVRIFEYGPRFAHQKVYHVDDWCSVGSSNFNYRSFLHDLEIDVVITKPENRAHLVSRFEKDQAGSTELTLADLERLPLWRRFLGRLLLVFRYWT